VINLLEVKMKLRHLFTVNLFLAVFFGISCSLFPLWVLHLYGLASNDAAIWTTRLVGGSILGFAVSDGQPVPGVLEDWTHTFVKELDTVQLFDLPSGASIYRVFLRLSPTWFSYG
jgi:hypothetical protein